MGWVMMSERELNRVEVLSQVVDRHRTAGEAAAVLGLSVRQVQRLLARFRDGGAAAIRHKARGRSPNNRKDAAVRDYVLSLIRESYADFGPTLATEKLAEEHGLKVSRETVRKWMVSDGIWLDRKTRRTFHQPRLRRERYGELVQIDGSDHRWFEDRADPCTLLVFIDDATSKLMELRFVPSESTFSYFLALERYLQTHGRPVAFYSDHRATLPDWCQNAPSIAGSRNGSARQRASAHGLPSHALRPPRRRDRLPSCTARDRLRISRDTRRGKNGRYARRSRPSVRPAQDRRAFRRPGRELLLSEWHLVRPIEAWRPSFTKPRPYAPSGNWKVKLPVSTHKNCPASIQIPIPAMARFSLSEMKPSGTFEPPPTQAHFRSRLST